MVFTQNYLGPNIYRCFPIDNNKKTAISINKKSRSRSIRICFS
ncbi:hypothetical protein EADG_05456, partial [Escherichia coli E1114]